MKPYLFFFLCWLGALSIGVAQQNLPPVYEFKPDSAFVTIDTAHFQILEDPDGTFTFDQVQRSKGFHYDSYYNPNRLSYVCWIRMRIKNTQPNELNVYLCDLSSNDFGIYWLDANKRWQHQRTGGLTPRSQQPDQNGNKEHNRLFFHLAPGQETTIFQRSGNAFWNIPLTYLSPQLQTEDDRVKSVFKQIRIDNRWKEYFFDGIMIGILFLAACYNLFISFSTKEKVYLYFGICLVFFTLDRNSYWIRQAFFAEHPYAFELTSIFFFIIYFVFFIQSIRKFIQPTPDLSSLNKAITALLALTTLVNLSIFLSYHFFFSLSLAISITTEVLIRLVYLLCIVLTVKMIKRENSQARFVLIAISPLFAYWLFTLIMRVLVTYFNVPPPYTVQNLLNYIESFCFAWLIIVFSGALIDRYNLIRKQVVQQAIEKEQLEKEREIERKRILESQNELLEKQVEDRTAKLKQSLETLKAAQNQLIQKEKLASLGELTAGIAHEIQNPLNFVNNFSEVSVELVDELKEEAQAGRTEEVLAIADDLTQNLERIHHHGKRADSIVKGMLEHSRTSTGEKQLTNLNALADEYLRLAYHGLRAKDKSFNAELKLELDPALAEIKLVPQDVGRVLLNLYNNAFYAIQEKAKKLGTSYQPQLLVTTHAEQNKVVIRVKDNGTGIPQNILKKIYQPFFTTKPTGEGTGLGLSLSYDIITQGHNGEMIAQTQEGEGTEFIITLPQN